MFHNTSNVEFVFVLILAKGGLSIKDKNKMGLWAYELYFCFIDQYDFIFRLYERIWHDLLQQIAMLLC